MTGHVTGPTGTRTGEKKASLEKSLTACEARKGSQLAVLVIPSSAPEEIEPYALRVAEQWKLGRKKVDDGAILVVVKNDRTMRIEVGYGLEGAVPDIVAGGMIKTDNQPIFAQGKYFEGY